MWSEAGNGSIDVVFDLGNRLFTSSVRGQSEGSHISIVILVSFSQCHIPIDIQMAQVRERLADTDIFPILRICLILTKSEGGIQEQAAFHMIERVGHTGERL